VGIAGEDDLDAPDVAGNVLDRGKLNGNGAAERAAAAGTLGAFAKNRKPWTPPKQALAPEASAVLRDRLLGELGSLASADQATGWAQRALGAKNTLRDVDAAVVEAAFAARMAELGDGAEATLPPLADASHDPVEALEPPGRAELIAALRASVALSTAGKAEGSNEVPVVAGRRRRKRQRREPALPTPPQPAAPAQPELPPVNNAVPWHVDKNALPLSEPRRYRDRAHLEFVASQPCLLCGRQPCDAHHLRFMQPRALGRRVSDEFAVPLCRTHHRALHRSGDEASWWKSTDLDPVLIAQRLWQHTRLNGSPFQEHIDPLLSSPSVHDLIPLAHASDPLVDPKASDRTSQPDSPPTGPPR
jgi:hypothetical protein